jgi:superfamily II DNA or RNA helicase
MGKTVLAVYLITQALRRKACVLVHKTLIRDQWKSALETFCPGIRVGFVQGNTWEVEGCDVVIAMILTLAKRDVPLERLDCIGTVVCDECHHMAAPVMSRAMRKFRARYILGLTATKERPDGLTPLLHMTLGAEAFRAERLGGESVRVTMAFLPSCVSDIKTRDGKPLTSVMITKLAMNRRRNLFIAKRVGAMRRNGRIIMVLSDRIDQLTTLREMIAEEGVPPAEIGMLYGKTPDEERCVELAKEVALCSYGMANEGLDKREADTCVMASPKGRVVQCIGRVQRPCSTKKSPLVLDIVDDNRCFQSLRWTRQRTYAKEKYQVQIVEVTPETDDSVWFT